MSAKIAIIPARGGSKRIPHKNVKEFCGKPIISYSIEVAIKSGLFDEIMVSTDDLEIADLSKSYGASIPFTRSSKNSNDHATLSDVVKEVLEWYEGKNKSFNAGCCILPTAPFITKVILSNGMTVLEKNDIDLVFPIKKYEYPIWRSLRMDSNSGRLSYNWTENSNSRSQDLEEAYHDTGMFYWFKAPSFLTRGTFNMGNAKGIEIGKYDTLDIDDIEDWKFAEEIYSLRKRNSEQNLNNEH